MSDLIQNRDQRGPIAWMTHNRVTPNLLMIVLVVGGFFFARPIKQEVFPDFELDMVQVAVPYPGSSPEEVEQGIVLAVEEAIRGLDGIKEITATASEGQGVVMAELLEGADNQRIYQDIKQEIDCITTFPEDAEEPEVSMIIDRRGVLDIALYGDASEWVLREMAEQVRDSLLQNPEITQVELEGARDYEVQVLVDQDTLRTYGLTLQDIANKIKSSAIELPGGHIETGGGEVLLRITERRDWANEFGEIPIITTADGSMLYLKDVATVKDDFADVDREAYFNGHRAIGIAIYRIGDQTPIGVSRAAQNAMKEIEAQLPPGIDWVVTNNMADVYQQRLELLLKNAFLGLVLVLCLLGVFLEFKLAFWVTMGIPTSFLGSFLILPQMDVTINMISMFAFIIALGIVVDDAIVVGENIHEYRNRGMGHLKAAILGARDVALPVTFSILTNIIAFLPLFFIPGVIGKIWKAIPYVVITVFSISWIESLVILPAHLGHAHRQSSNPIARFLHEKQQAFSRLFERFIERLFSPFLDFCIKFRYVTIALAFAVFLSFLSHVTSGRFGMILMPRAESDYSVVSASLPFGSPSQDLREVADLLMQSAEEVIAENGQEELSKGIFITINEDNLEVSIFLTDPKVRPITTTQLTQLWREKTGQIPGLEKLRFEADSGGPGSGAALSIELSHRDLDVLDQASERLAELLGDFSNVKDIDDGYTPGKQQLNFTIKPEGESLGLTAQEIARQIRN